MISTDSRMPTEVVEEVDCEPKFRFNENRKDSSANASSKNISVVEDDHVDCESFDYYLNLGGDYGAGVLKKAENPNEILEKLYLGCGTGKDIEKKLTYPSSMGVYHRQVGHSVEIFTYMSLHVVYRSSNNVFKHYPIEVLNKNNQLFYYLPVVEKRFFSSLADLLSFYTTYVYSWEENGKQHIEMFL